MKVFVKNKGAVNLTKSNFVAAGGEGEIYAQGSTAYKIYLDPSHMIPEAKIQELGQITDPDVNKPHSVLVDSKGKPIGYTTTFIKKAMPLCSMFPIAFRTRNNIDPSQTLALVKRLQQMIENIHAANVLVVDLNEMNFLLSNVFDKIYAIDVDSYQTPHFPATAIMDTIRDRHTPKNTFNIGTDWFSFAITSFQMFRGIHPYKGKHPSLKGLDARMMANMSVLNSAVSVPKAVLPESVIPDSYLDWYRAVLDDGKRVPPPTGTHNIIVIAPKSRAIGNGDGNIIIVELGTKVRENIVRVFYSSGSIVTIADPGIRDADGVVYHNSHPMLSISDKKSLVAFSPKTNEPILASKDGIKLKLTSIFKRTDIPIDLDVDAMSAYDGRLLVHSHGSIFEVNLTEAGGSIFATAKPVGNALPYATKLFSGVAIQSLLGSVFASIFPDRGACYQVKMEELDKYKIIEAKFDSGVLMVIGATKNQYDRLIFRFNSDYSKYDCRIVEDITNTGLNFITLETGICVCLNEDEDIEAFSAKMGSNTIKIVQDSILGGDMTLFKMGGKVGMFRGDKLYQISMR